MSDLTKFNAICASEKLFVANPLGLMLIIQNQINHTVGDGYTSSSEFCNLQERLALTAGPKDSESYNAKLKELKEIYENAKKGI